MVKKEYIGIIVPKELYDSFPHVRGNEREMLHIWQKASERLQVIPCYFRLVDIQPKQDVIYAYVKEQNHYIKRKIKAPTVIYSRVLDHLPAFRSHIDELRQSGKVIFNVPNYDVEKFKIHEILEKDAYLQNHLPKTLLFSIDNLNEMAASKKQLILKRNYGEFGIGAMKLEKEKETWCVSYKSSRDKALKKEYFKKKLPVLIQKRLLKHTYIIQEMIPLARYKSGPFDMRVAVQKNKQGEFQVSGIMCKVAQDDDFLTNGQQGGTAFSFDEIAPYSHPSIPYNQLVEPVTALSLHVAQVLDKHFPCLADLGLDIGITKDGKPYFIECNFISDYVGGLFQDGKLIKKEWESVFTTPIEYAKGILDQENHRKKD